MASEEDFPRGGSFRKGPPGVQSVKKRKDIPDLFKVSSTESDKKAGKKRKRLTEDGGKSKKIKKAEDDGGIDITKIAESEIQELSLRVVGEGMRILGRVKEVNEYNLVVSLPNGLTGTVPITGICEAYTHQLQSLASGDEELVEAVHGLNELFHIGDLVRCIVTGVVQNGKGKDSIQLSVDPKLVNEGVHAKSLSNVMVLCGCVASVEDHGYTVDIGVKGLKAFLSSEEAGDSLFVGQYLHCLLKNYNALELKSGETRVVGISVDPTTVGEAVVSQSEGCEFKSLVPGMKVKAKVLKVTHFGLLLKYLGKYKGFVHNRHLPGSSQGYEKSQEVTACILYIHPVTKAVSLSLLPHLCRGAAPELEQFTAYNIGDVVEEATVLRVDKKRGALLRLENKVRGFVSVKQICDTNVKDLNRHVKKGSIVKCRVIGYDLMDNVAVVTMKPSVINQKFLSINDVIPGSVVECTVKKIVQFGIVVKVSNLRGFIPNMHLAEVMLKHPEKKFTEGKALNCRVLMVKPEDNKLILTNKKSLVRSELPILTSFDQLSPGLVVEGYIVHMQPAGLVMAFYNGIKGFVPKRELSFEKIDYPEKVFYLGQVAKARVLQWDVAAERITLSFKIDGDVTPRFQRQSMRGAEKIEIGQLVDCEVRARTETGLDVFIESLGIKAFISKMYLSDFIENCDLLLNTYSPGDMIKDAMCVSKSGNVSLTLKHSLVSASREGILPKRFEDIQMGLMFPGVMKNSQDYGIFVDLLNDFAGLVPNRYLGDDYIPKGVKPFQQHQSLVTKVIGVDQEKKRFLLSLRMFDCYYGDTDIGIELLSNYLEERKRIVETFLNEEKLKKKKKRKGQFDGIEIGHVYTATISKVTDHGVLCQLEQGVNGIIIQQHLKETDHKPGDGVEVLVLYIDTEAGCLELSSNPDHIKAVNHRTENKFSAVKCGQTIKSQVILVKEEFVLVMLMAHGAGKLAYLPTKRHLNDAFGKCQFEVGQINRVVIKRVEDDHVLASWYIYEEELQKTKGKHSLTAPSKVAWHDLQLGNVVTARIKEILPFQMNLRIVTVPARVFISEAADTFENGALPLSGRKVNDEIQVKIIGFRDCRTQKAVSLSALKKNKAVPECSLKDSKLEVNGPQPGDPIPKEFKVGDVVPAFVQKYSGSCLYLRITPERNGRVYHLNLSEDPKILEDPESHFSTIGQCYNATVIKTGEDDLLELSLVASYNIIPGAIVNGQISEVRHNNVRVRLSGGHWGNVALTDLDDEYSDNPTEKYSVGQFVRCYVKTCKDDKHCAVSLRKSRVESSDEVKDMEVKSLSDHQVGTVLRGFIRSCSTSGALVSLSSDVIGHVNPSKLSDIEISNPSEVFYPGKVVTAKVLSINADERKTELSLLEKDTGVPESVDSKLHVSKQRNNPKKRKNEDEEAEKKRLKADPDSDSGIDDQKMVDSESDDDDVPITKQKSTKSRLNLSSGFTWDDTFSLPSKAVRKDESSDDDSDAETEQKNVKKTKQEKRDEKRAEEKKLCEMENLYLDHDRAPETADDFDRLCIQSPDSSLVWLRYMAFHLETAEIEKARAVAERALKCISFREEQEKLNIWVAYLNLENMYGTGETLQNVFQRAIQHNDPLKVYQQLISIYEKSQKFEEAEQLYKTMVKRFSLRTDVWVSFGMFYFRNNKLESARKLMQRALASLQSLEKKRNDVEIIAKFAQMEFKFGEPERGTTMFENILSNYPKRTDLWSVYIDMLTKKGDTEAVRVVFERVINLSVSAKKMKFFFKKYLDFETRFGTEESVSEVKQKALEYVESKASEMD